MEEGFNPFEELEKAIIRLWDYEEKERNEIAIEIDFPSKFIEWNDIIIEAWVIYTPKKSIHIYENSIINSKVGILLTLEKPLIGSLRSIDIIRVLQCFKHARDVVEFIAYGLKYKCFDVDSVKEAFHHYITSEGYNIKMASNVHLIIDKPNGNLLDIIDGKTKLLIY